MKKLEKEEIQASLFADDTILYKEVLTISTRKPPQLVNAFSKVAKYKFNTQKLVAFLYTNDEQTEKEPRKQNHSQ